MIVAGDNRDPVSLLEQTGPVELLVHEATFTEDVVDQIGSDQGHSTAARVARAARDAGVDHLILTHFSPRYTRGVSSDGHSIAEIASEASANFDGTLVLADDFATYDLTADGTLIEKDA